MTEKASKQVRELANHVQLLQDELVVMFMQVSALVELLTDGRPITPESVEERRKMILAACQKEWLEQQKEVN